MLGDINKPESSRGTNVPFPVVMDSSIDDPNEAYSTGGAVLDEADALHDEWLKFFRDKILDYDTSEIEFHNV